MQKIINTEFVDGVVGDFFDNSPRRVDGHILNNVVGSKATGSITITNNPTANDTITIGNEIYKFVSAVSNDFEVAIGSTADESADNLATTINTLSRLVNATVDNNTVDLTCQQAGNNGNGLILAVSNTTDASAIAFNGGENEILPTVGKVFTLVNDKAIQGGNGAYLGILVNSKEYVNNNNLVATLNVANGSQGSICSMGRIFVKVNNAVEIGYIVAFSSDGSLYGYATELDVPADQTIIKNSKFVIKPANINDIAIVELN